MSRRKILIGVSIAGHAALFAGVAIHGIWDLEQVEYEFRSRTALSVMTPPAPPQGGSYEPRPLDVKRKEAPKVVVKEPRQPRKLKDELRITMDHGSSDDGLGAGKAPGDGPGDGPGGGGLCQERAGLCGTGAGLPALPDVPPPPPVRTHDIRPEILKGLRIRGETAIHPPKDVYDQMADSKTYEATASIKLCLTAEGTVSSVKLTTSTGYPAYDRAFVAAAWHWVYRPYTVNGTPVPACGMVTFQYAMR